MVDPHNDSLIANRYDTASEWTTVKGPYTSDIFAGSTPVYSRRHVTSSKDEYYPRPANEDADFTTISQSEEGNVSLAPDMTTEPVLPASVDPHNDSLIANRYDTESKWTRVEGDYTSDIFAGTTPYNINMSKPDTSSEDDHDPATNPVDGITDPSIKQRLKKKERNIMKKQLQDLLRARDTLKRDVLWLKAGLVIVFALFIYKYIYP